MAAIATNIKKAIKTPTGVAHCAERFFTCSHYSPAFLESHRAGFAIRSCDLFSFCLIAPDIHTQCFTVEHTAFIVSITPLI